MITSSQIAFGDQLGAQMNTLANLFYISKITGQNICFWNELSDFKRGFTILKYFDLNEIIFLDRSNFIEKSMIQAYCRQFGLGKNWRSRNKRIYSRYFHQLDKIMYSIIIHKYKDFQIIKGNNGEFTSDKVLNLNKDKNYDIVGGFGTCKSEWGKYRDELISLFRFKNEIVEQGDTILSSIDISKPTVGIHYRRTDYLIMSSLNLNEKYYKKALEKFNRDKFTFLIFSDDIDGVRNDPLLSGLDTRFIEGNSAGIDMYLMSKCDNNIIANSTFSLWGALLNKNKGITVCPHDFAGQGSGAEYLNGNWYPKEWVAIK